jgi:large repetitive protein
MHKAAGVLAAVAMVLPVGVIASAAGAAVAMSCASVTGSTTYSPPLPSSGDPTTVMASTTGTATLTGCVGLGITSGKAVFSGQPRIDPLNCDTLTNLASTGTTTVIWNTGQTSTLNTAWPFETGQVTSGLFVGATVDPGPAGDGIREIGSCATPLATYDWSEVDPLTVVLPAGVVSCLSPQPCDATEAATATTAAPGLVVTVTGTPAVGTGSTHLTIASASLACPAMKPAARPVATLTDTGFAPTDTLNVTATLPLASSTSAEQVCFKSTVPFKSQSSPTVAKAGTAFLLNCSQVANVAPCVTSSKQVGSNVVVTFVVPGGDPRFSIVLPKGRQAWLSKFAAAKIGKPYSAQLESSGGIAPVKWSKTKGNLPPGCTLNPTTGAITGTPKTKGAFSAVVRATDSEKKPQTASLTVPITVS